VVNKLAQLGQFGFRKLLAAFLYEVLHSPKRVPSLRPRLVCVKLSRDLVDFMPKRGHTSPNAIDFVRKRFPDTVTVPWQRILSKLDRQIEPTSKPFDDIFPTGFPSERFGAGIVVG
jgi:hypothetical protein